VSFPDKLSGVPSHVACRVRVLLRPRFRDLGRADIDVHGRVSLLWAPLAPPDALSADTEEEDDSYYDTDSDDNSEDGDDDSSYADMSRAEFECVCGNNFETWAERTSTFTVECRSCGRLVRPRRFVDGEKDTDEDDCYTDDYATDTEAESEAGYLPRYGVAWFNCHCGHGFTSHAERAPDFTCRCHRCGSNVPPGRFLPPGERGMRRTTNRTHTCCRCEGRGRRFVCPVLRESATGLPNFLLRLGAM
jgi:hypothetical protein